MIHPFSISLPTLGLAAANLPAIESSLMAAETAFTANRSEALTTALTSLQGLVQELPDAHSISRDLERILSGKKSLSQKNLDKIFDGVRDRVSQFESEQAVAAKPGPLGKANPYLVELDSVPQYQARDDQRYIAGQRAPAHFAESKRGIFRYDTGMGKSLTYGFIIQQLQNKLPKVFDQAVTIFASHQAEPAVDLAKQIKGVFPDQTVAFLGRGITKQDLRGVRHVVGTYQQLAQEKTVKTLIDWVGRRRALFVLDEADMVVFKGIHPGNIDKLIEDDSEGVWHPSWFQPLIEFGLFSIEGSYNPRCRHYMLGGTATLDRPDGISLSTVWGPGNVFYHTPMAEGVRKGMLVPVLGKVVSMDIPKDADLWDYRAFTQVTPTGKLVVDPSKVQSAVTSDYGVKTAVRSYMDHGLMAIGAGPNKSLSIRKAIGFAGDTSSLEKHMRWQQDLFDLVEVLFRIYNGLRSKMRAENILKAVGGKKGWDNFGMELERFLYRTEWRSIDSLYERASAALWRGRRDAVRDLFETLYDVLNVDARRLKGRRLIATAAWDHMGHGPRGGKIRPDRDSSIEAAVQHFPHQKWPNFFGNRGLTMQAFKAGEIDILWSIDMIDRGFNYPMASLAIDNAPTRSRRELVQRIGRVMRPPDGRNPRDHSRKPEAIYLTITPNLDVHKIDQSRQDVARSFGTEVDPFLGVIRLRKGDPQPIWRTPDEIQLEPRGEKTVHLIRVGVNLSKAVTDYLQKRYGDDFDIEVAAFDSGVSGDELHSLFNATQFPKENKLKQWLKSWGASRDEIRQIMSIYHSDLADMKTVYGGAWRIISRGGA